MHIAICLWGLCRSSHITYESFKQYILDSLNTFGFTYEIFLHTYDVKHVYTNNRACELNVVLNNDNWKLFKPNKFLIEDDSVVNASLNLLKYRTHPDPWGSDFKDSTFNNHIRALYSLKQVTSLWSQNASKYDAVIYCRPDVSYLCPLERGWFAPDRLSSCVQLPTFHKYPVNDRFSISIPDIGIIYGSRFNDAYNYSLTKSLHSETFLQYTLNKHNIVIYTIPFLFKRIRSNGIDSDPGVSLDLLNKIKA